jgi:hypothetical protein
MTEETVFIDTALRKRYAFKVLISTIVFLHIISFILVIALIRADKAVTDTQALAAMFSTSMFGIGATIFLLISNKAVDALLNKLGANQMPVPGKLVESTTKTTEITSPDKGKQK